jgi:broad specificity polyphosphatase/5'/3'-nucleotidase SurE
MSKDNPQFPENAYKYLKNNWYKILGTFAVAFSLSACAPTEASSSSSPSTPVDGIKQSSPTSSPPETECVWINNPNLPNYTKNAITVKDVCEAMYKLGTEKTDTIRFKYYWKDKLKPPTIETVTIDCQNIPPNRAVYNGVGICTR